MRKTSLAWQFGQCHTELPDLRLKRSRPTMETLVILCLNEA
jgi:hypothetical protein